MLKKNHLNYTFLIELLLITKRIWEGVYMKTKMNFTQNKIRSAMKKNLFTWLFIAGKMR